MAHSNRPSPLVFEGSRHRAAARSAQGAHVRHELLGIVALVSVLSGCQGMHVQGGPVVGYSPTRGATFGWEAGAGAFGLVRLSSGGSYRIEPGPPQAPAGSDADEETGVARDLALPPEYVHYLALEPLGATLGIDISDASDVRFMGGVWAGWIYDPNPDGMFGSSDNPFRPDLDCPNSEPESALLVSGAVGFRYLGGEWEVYATPKAVLLYCFEYAS